jgi:hypothetical protein
MSHSPPRVPPDPCVTDQDRPTRRRSTFGADGDATYIMQDIGSLWLGGTDDLNPYLHRDDHHVDKPDLAIAASHRAT